MNEELEKMIKDLILYSLMETNFEFKNLTLHEKMIIKSQENLDILKLFIKGN